MFSDIRSPFAQVAAAFLVFAFSAMPSQSGAQLVWSDVGRINASDYHPDLDFPAPGRVVAAWMTNNSAMGATNGRNIIAYSRSDDSGVSWSSPVVVSAPHLDPNADNWLPDIAADASGNVVIAWHRSLPSPPSILVSHSSDFGVTWSVPQNLTPAGIRAASRFQATTDGRGTWMIAWGSGAGLQLSRSVDHGATWTTRSFFAGFTDGVFVADTDLAYSRKGVWMTVWRSSTNMHICCARSTDEGRNWSPPLQLGTGDAPKIRTDRDGNWVAVWNSDMHNADLMVSRSANDGIAWSPPAVISLPNNPTANEPALETDGAGTWITIWPAWRSSPSYYNDLYYSVSTDNGATWSTSTTLITQSPYKDAQAKIAPVLASDRMGDWIAAWYSYGIPGSAGGVCYQRLHLERPFRVYLTHPKPDMCVAGNAVLVKAEVEPADTAVEEVLFEYRAPGSAVFQAIPAATLPQPNPDTTRPYFVHWNVTSLPAGQYEVRATATLAGIPYYSEIVTVSVQPNCARDQSITVGGENLNIAGAGPDGYLDIAGAAGNSPVTVEAMVPPGGLYGTPTLSMLLHAASDAASAPKIEDDGNIGSVIDLTLSSGQVNFNTDLYMRLTFDYSDVGNDGIVDGTSIPESDLKVCRYGGSSWTLVSNATIDPIANRVTVHVGQVGTYVLKSYVPNAACNWYLYE